MSAFAEGFGVRGLVRAFGKERTCPRGGSPYRAPRNLSRPRKQASSSAKRGQVRALQSAARDIGLCVLAVFFTACTKHDAPQVATGTPVTDAIAVVGGEAVPFEAIRATAAQNGYNLTETSGADLALRDTVNFELLAKEAERLGYEKEPGIRQLVKGMIVQKLVREKVDAQLPQLPKPADRELRAYFDKHAAEFTQPTLAKAQLLFLLKREGGDEALAKKRGELEEALKGGLPFADAVKKFSDDPAVQATGGVTNWIIQGQPQVQHPPDIVEAIFKVANSEAVAGPVETKQGVYWAKLVERRDGKVTTFEEARAQIAQRVDRQKRLELYDGYVAGLRKQFPVELHPERLKEKVASETKQPGPPMGPVRMAK